MHETTSNHRIKTALHAIQNAKDYGIIDLRHLQINDAEFSEIAKEIPYTVKSVLISHNKITDLSPLLRLANLEMLSATHTQISEYPNDMPKSIKILFLDNTNISGIFVPKNVKICTLPVGIEHVRTGGKCAINFK